MKTVGSVNMKIDIDLKSKRRKLPKNEVQFMSATVCHVTTFLKMS